MRVGCVFWVLDFVHHHCNLKPEYMNMKVELFYCDCCYLLGQLYFINSYNYQIYNTITWNVALKPLIAIQLRTELHSDSSNGILTMPQHAAAVNVNWWYECFIDIVLWILINISILYMHFVKCIFSTYCIARVWYDLCPKKKKKKEKEKRRKKKVKKKKKNSIRPVPDRFS